MNKKVDKVRFKQKLQVTILEQQQEASKIIKTSRTSSSCVCKIRIIQGEKTWSVLMFPDDELSGGTTHNTSSSAVSSDTIKIGQLFHNKANSKMKLHVYAMKRNFKFKMKKLGKDV